MVRKVVYFWWIVILLFYWLQHQTAFAEEVGPEVPVSTVTVNPPSTTETKLDGIDQRVSDLNTKLEDLTTYLKQQDELDEIDNTQERQLDYLSSIDDKLTQIYGESDVSEAEQQPVRAESVQFVAYANASPSGTYYNYSQGLMPRLGLNDHYVYLQDTQSSYVFAYGSFDYDEETKTFTGQEITWVRWFNQGAGLGYRVETGQSEVSVTCRDYMVLSDLGDWPLIISDEMPRREVMIYAVVAIAIYSLHSVWSYTLRNRNGT